MNNSDNYTPSDYILFLRMEENIKKNWLFYLIFLDILVFGYIVFALVYMWPDKYTVDTFKEFIPILLITPLMSIIPLNIIFVTAFTNLYRRIAYLLFLATVILGYFLYTTLFHYRLSFSIPLYSLSPYISTFGDAAIFIPSIIAPVPIIIFLKTCHVKEFLRVAAYVFICFVCIQYFISLIFSLGSLENARAKSGWRVEISRDEAVQLIKECRVNSIYHYRDIAWLQLKPEHDRMLSNKYYSDLWKAAKEVKSRCGEIPVQDPESDDATVKLDYGN